MYTSRHVALTLVPDAGFLQGFQIGREGMKVGGGGDVNIGY